MSRLARREELTAWLFVAPNMLGFLFFTVLCTAGAIGLSLTKWDIVTPPVWIGFGNFREMAKDPVFWKTLKNTFVFTFGSVPPAVAIGMLSALALNRKFSGRLFFRTIYFLPVVTSMYVIAMVWRWFYNPDFGILNEMLWRLGVEQPPNWLTNRTWAMVAVIVLAVWKQLGYNMVLFLAGLQGIPSAIHEAASIDGASAWDSFWHITIPLLTPTTFFVLVISIIQSFQAFDAVVALTDGGPADATRTLVLYIYDNAFRYLKMGYGSALALVLLLIVLSLTLVQWKLQRHWVNYE
ncbi:MAG: sugar ABC transporter permease [Bacillota bacterium]